MIPPSARKKELERKGFALVGAAIVIFLLVIGFTLLWYTIHKPSPTLSVNHYVDNARCLQCHQDQAREWKSSHHAKAMAFASDTTVSGDFNQTHFVRDGVTTRFFKDNNHYYINTQGPDGQYANFPIRYTLGVAPLQQYLIELPGGRLQNFTLAWDMHHHHWFDLYPQEHTPPGDVLHWAGCYQNANAMCITCHTTGYQKNYDVKTDHYASTWSGMNVGCQACHGPGQHHVQWATSFLQGKNKLYNRAGEHKGWIIDFKHDGAERVVDTCGMCHARRSELTASPQAGQAFMDNYLPALLTPDLYYPDGQQQSEVYVYNSFRQSKMYQKGVSCVDCHQAHTGQLKAIGNAVCTQCHRPQGNPRFELPKKRYDHPSHTFHPLGTPGAQCVNCHMPAKKYMRIHARPDHSIRIPRPDLSVKLGTPNACNACHVNRSAKWAADKVSAWYGSHHSPIHYGEILAAGRAGKGEAALVELAGDAQQPSVVRASALDLLSHYGPASIAASISNLHDEHPEIRRAAVTGLERLSPSERLPYLLALLHDPIRAVRIEAARVLSSVPETQFDQTNRPLFNHALQEFIAAENLSLDMPASYLNLAVLNENQAHWDQAEKEYRQALFLDPDFTPARLNLAQLYLRLNQQAQAEKILQDGIQRLPTQGELHYSLGLLFAEENRLAEAGDALKQAAHLFPERARVHYNYGLVLQQLQHYSLAEHELLTAYKLEPSNATFIYALTIFYMQNHDSQQALYFANALKKENPQDGQVQQLIEEIKSMGARVIK